MSEAFATFGRGYQTIPERVHLGHTVCSSDRAIYTDLEIELCAHRRRRAPADAPGIAGAASAARVLRGTFPDLADAHVEHFVALALNAKNKVTAAFRLAKGGLTSISLNPREIFAPVILAAAPGMIIAHNHPSGDPAPSVDDWALTRRIKNASRDLGIALLDHIIVAGDKHFSFVEEGGAW